MVEERASSRVKTFRDLIVWQKAHELVLEICKISKIFPDAEKFGLVSQLRRSSSSIPTNIVEGYKKSGNREFVRYLNISECSLEETKYHLLLAKDLRYFSETEFNRLSVLCDEIGRMLSSLLRRLSE